MTDSPSVVIVGAGGHGVVVYDVLRRAGRIVAAFVDEAETVQGTTVMGVPVVAPEAVGAPSNALVIVGIGNNAARRGAYERFRSRGYDTCVAVHPSAVVGEHVTLAPGTVVMAGVVINPRTDVGENAVLNTGCRVDHDCRIGAHVHIAPGATITGAVSIGQSTLIGAGAVILPGVKVGSGAIVGAGAVVVRDVADGSVVIGVPARAVRP